MLISGKPNATVADLSSNEQKTICSERGLDSGEKPVRSPCLIFAYLTSVRLAKR